MPKQGMHGFAHHDVLVQSILHPAYMGLRHDADAAQDCSSNSNHTKLVNATHVLYWLKVPPLRQSFKCEWHESDFIFMCASDVAHITCVMHYAHSPSLSCV